MSDKKYIKFGTYVLSEPDHINCASNGAENVNWSKPFIYLFNFAIIILSA